MQYSTIQNRLSWRRHCRFSWVGTWGIHIRFYRTLALFFVSILFFCSQASGCSMWDHPKHNCCINCNKLLYARMMGAFLSQSQRKKEGWVVPIHFSYKRMLQCGDRVVSRCFLLLLFEFHGGCRLCELRVVVQRSVKQDQHPTAILWHFSKKSCPFFKYSKIQFLCFHHSKRVRTLFGKFLSVSIDWEILGYRVIASADHQLIYLSTWTFFPCSFLTGAIVFGNCLTRTLCTGVVSAINAFQNGKTINLLDFIWIRMRSKLIGVVFEKHCFLSGPRKKFCSWVCAVIVLQKVCCFVWNLYTPFWLTLDVISAFTRPKPETCSCQLFFLYLFLPPRQHVCLVDLCRKSSPSQT